MPVYAPSTSALSAPTNFFVYRNAAANSGSAGFGIVNFDTKVYDTGNNVDIVTNIGRFTPTITGYYLLNAQFETSISVTADMLISFFKAGSEWVRGGRDGGTNQGHGTNVTVTAKLTATTDYIEVYVFGNPQFALGVGTPPYQTYFTGFLLSTS